VDPKNFPEGAVLFSSFLYGSPAPAAFRTEKKQFPGMLRVVFFCMIL